MRISEREVVTRPRLLLLLGNQGGLGGLYESVLQTDPRTIEAEDIRRS